METTARSHEYRPQLISRRGELNAWGLALAVGATWLILLVTRKHVGAVVPVLEIFLILAALSISLGNWIDRRTLLKLDDRGVSFANGLRNVRLDWPQILQVRVLPASSGKRIQVLGVRQYFGFRTASEVRFQGINKGRFGFEAGDDIVRTLIKNSGLKLIQRSEQGEVYARQ